MAPPRPQPCSDAPCGQVHEELKWRARASRWCLAGSGSGLFLVAMALHVHVHVQALDALAPLSSSSDTDADADHEDAVIAFGR